MVARNLRGELIPTGIIFLTSDASSPTGYSDECALYGKYVIGIPTACTNPGSAVGSATHSHAAGGAHGHGPYAQPHTHSGSFSPHVGSVAGAWIGPYGTSGTKGPVGSTTHTHPVTGNTTASTITTTPAAAHCHGTGPSEAGLKRTTTRYIKKSSVSVNLRTRHMPIGVTGMWDCNLSSIPPDFNDCSNYYDRYLKGIATSCAATLSNTCAAPHTHPNSGSCHVHSVAAAVHTHPITVGATTAPLTKSVSGCQPAVSVVITAHPHGAPALGPASNAGVCSSGNLHTHASNVEMKRIAISHIKRNTIFNLRRFGAPNNLNALWLCPLACIPTGWALNSSTIDRYPKGILNACTCPGGVTGAHCHGHGPEAAHTHTFTAPHTHPGSPTGTAPATPLTNGPLSAPTATAKFAGAHAHTFASVGGSVAGTVPSCGAHSHGSTTSKPCSVETAFIQRV